MKNRVCEILGIEKPVISAAMVWLNDAEQVAALANAGGAGVLGLNAGSWEVTPDPIETRERLRRQVQKVRELTDKPFGVNFFLAPEMDEFSKGTLEVILEEKVPFVLAIPVGFPFDMDVVKQIKDAGTKIVYRPMSPTVELMKEAESFADIIICTGSEGGGHNSDYNASLISIFPAIRKAVKAPLMAAGGICEELGAKAAAAMGAEGIYAGTCFLATEESRMHKNAKEKIVEAKASDLIKVPSMPGWLHLMPNAIGRHLEKMYKEGATGPEINKYYMSRGGFRTAMLDGDVENGILNFSEAVDNITEIRPVKAVVDELAAPFAE